jgi:hypothetical protein
MLQDIIHPLVFVTPTKTSDKKRKYDHLNYSSTILKLDTERRAMREAKQTTDDHLVSLFDMDDSIISCPELGKRNCRCSLVFQTETDLSSPSARDFRTPSKAAGLALPSYFDDRKEERTSFRLPMRKGKEALSLNCGTRNFQTPPPRPVTPLSQDETTEAESSSECVNLASYFDEVAT